MVIADRLSPEPGVEDSPPRHQPRIFVDAFPAFFPLAGRTVVIAGAGEAAEAKARLFEGSPARVTMVAGDAARDPRSYAGAALAFVASDDDAFAEAAAR